MFTKITTKALLKKIDILRGITRIKNIFVLDVNSLDGLLQSYNLQQTVT